MLTANNTIFSSKNALNGPWRNVNNWTAFSIHVTGLEGNVWIEVSNDPNALTNGSNVIGAPATPVLSQYTPTADQHILGVPVDTTYYVKTTYLSAAGTSLADSGNSTSTSTIVGETTASSEASLLVKAGNLLSVASPAQDAAGLATAWGVYVSTASGQETLQMKLGISQTYNLWAMDTNLKAPPSVDTSGSPSAGVIITGNLATHAANPTNDILPQSDLAFSNDGAQAMWSPSCLVWNYVRVCKDTTSQTKVTTAFLFGQTS
jgi:hypothetical protein